MSIKTRNDFLKSIVIVFIVIIFSSNKSFSENPSVFTSYNLKYGITIAIPQHWQILEKRLMDQIDTNTEVLTGIGQGNNDIVIAANYYENDNNKPKATVRVSVRTKQTASQADVTSWPQYLLDAMAEQAYQKVTSAMKKSGNKSGSISPYKMSKDNISGYVAIRSDYQDISPKLTLNTTIYIVYLGDRIIKLTMSYDAKKEWLLLPTINKIKQSVKIKR